MFLASPSTMLLDAVHCICLQCLFLKIVDEIIMEKMAVKIPFQVCGWKNWDTSFWLKSRKENSMKHFFLLDGFDLNIFWPFYTVKVGFASDISIITKFIYCFMAKNWKIRPKKGVLYACTLYYISNSSHFYDIKYWRCKKFELFLPRGHLLTVDWLLAGQN